MPLLVWIAVFAVSSLLWAWIIFWGGGGADWLEGSFLAGFLISWRAPMWTGEEMKAFVGVIWFLEGVWFAIGLFVPELRFL